MRDLDEARYPTRFASKVWRVPNPTGKLYVNKYLNLTPADRKAHVSGATTLLTGRRVLQGAIGAEIATRFRTGAGPACQAATTFTDYPDPDESRKYPNRNPAELFPKQFTALIAYPSGRGIVVWVDEDPLSRIFFPHGGAGIELDRQQEGAWVLMLDLIVHRVTEELDKFDRGEVA